MHGCARFKQLNRPRERVSITFSSCVVPSLPKHLVWDSEKLEAIVLDYCTRDDVQLNLNELLVIEYYSRR